MYSRQPLPQSLNYTVPASPMVSSPAAVHVSILAACAFLLSLLIVLHVSPSLLSAPFLEPSRTFQNALNVSSIVVAGDSQSRLFVLSFLDLLVDRSLMDQIQTDLFRRHSNYQIRIPNPQIDLDFVWAPFESNISTLIRDLSFRKRYPVVFVAGSGLWHMLHVTNSTDYGEKLREIGDLVGRIGIRSRLFWIGLPQLVDEKLNTATKRVKMNRSRRESYEREVKKSGILRRFSLLDVGRLSKDCGERCTEDGMHYNQVVYDKAVRIMLDVLAVESKRRI